MDKKLLALLLIIPITSIFITWYVSNSTIIKQNNTFFPKKNNQKKIADTFFNNAEIINFSEAGFPKSKIISAQILHYPGDEDSEISTPEITLFRDNNSHLYITADYGWINQDGTRIILKGHTNIKQEASQTSQFLQLETPELTIWPNKEYAETDKAVKITNDSTIVTGIGMEAYLDQKHYYLLNKVKVKHIPITNLKKTIIK